MNVCMERRGQDERISCYNIETNEWTCIGRISSIQFQGVVGRKVGVW